VKEKILNLELRLKQIHDKIKLHLKKELQQLKDLLKMVGLYVNLHKRQRKSLRKEFVMRSGGEKRKNYPKCVPIAKARAMSKGQRAGAVARKQAKANTGPTPSRAATFAKRKKAMMGGFMGRRMGMR
jgi:hypothetical protein